MNKEEKYKKAINELADSYELHLKQWAKRCIDTINEYTTNLQQENKKQKEVINDVIEYVENRIVEDDYMLKVDTDMVQKELLDILKEVSE